MSKYYYIFESVLDDISIDDAVNVADDIAQRSIDSEYELRAPGKEGWHNWFTIQLTKDIWKDFDRIDEGVREAVRARERLLHVLENTLWLDEFSDVWIYSGMMNEDFEYNGVVIHASEVTTKASLSFSINGRPRNTRDAL